MRSGFQHQSRGVRSGPRVSRSLARLSCRHAAGISPHGVVVTTELGVAIATNAISPSKGLKPGDRFDVLRKIRTGGVLEQPDLAGVLRTAGDSSAWHDFNPFAMIVQPLAWSREFRFYAPFRSFKRGRPQEVDELRRDFLERLDRLDLQQSRRPASAAHRLPSVDESIAELGSRHRALVVATEDAITSSSHEVVRVVANSLWHNSRRHCPLPRPAELAGDEQGGVALPGEARCLRLVVSDDVEGR